MSRTTAIAWLPLVLLPTLVVAFAPDAWPPWAFMWLLAVALFVGCKWLTWYSTRQRGSLGRQLAYWVLWPGLDAPAFLQQPNSRIPTWIDWGFALVKLSFGLTLLVVVYPQLPTAWELLRGWVGMIGIIFCLHFGLFDVFSVAWRTLGFTARPLMEWPLLATSVSDFWGHRWNTAFRDLTHRFVFRPLTSRWGAKLALFSVFVFSGLVHDLVISVPAGAGYGSPTAYFLIQAAALFLERTAVGQRLGLGRGVRGWAFALLVTLGPLPWLFHRPFVVTVIVPFLDWMVSL